MERSLKAPLSPHEEGALRRIALGISKPKHLPARDVDYLIRLGLVEEIEGRTLVEAVLEDLERLSSAPP